ncbi:hypothetical protein ACDZ29_25445 [Peribacillus sp. RS7]|uniref:hypothetical protein n=1 Tax=Peribacillus sp. RS7 TaxID=3242679 RepID=UPI0035C2203C
MKKFYRVEFLFYNDKGQVALLDKAVLSVLQGDIWTRVREPRIYFKENIAIVHAVNLDGLNLLYTLKNTGFVLHGWLTGCFQVLYFSKRVALAALFLMELKGHLV